MSFAIAMFDRQGKDLVVATDCRWVEGPQDNLTTISDAGLKSIRLNSRTALAFTGHTEIIAKVIAGLYGEGAFGGVSNTVLLDEIEKRHTKLKGAPGEFVSKLNEIVPRVMAQYPCGYRLSILLGARERGRPFIVWWAEESNWEGRCVNFGDRPYIQTFPPEAKRGSPLETDALAILDKFDIPASERIEKVITFLAEHPSVKTVSRAFQMRRALGGFGLPGQERKKHESAKRKRLHRARR